MLSWVTKVDAAGIWDESYQMKGRKQKYFDKSEICPQNNRTA